MVMSFVFGMCGLGLVNGQAYKTSNLGFECQAVNKREDCKRCGTRGEYGQVSKPEITCPKCEGVSNETLSKFPCSPCSNTRKVKDPNYVPPRKCEVCNGRGLVLTVGHKFQVADDDYTERLRWADALYACSNFGGGWRLPFLNELIGMYEFLHRKGKGNFQETWYWSSSQERYGDNAYGMSFSKGYLSSGGDFYYDQIRGGGKVRAVRYLPSTDDGYEIFTIDDGKPMQVAKEDFSSKMNRDDAMSACEGLGNGWRLPTKEELNEMYKQLHRKGKGYFQNTWYWSSSQVNSGNAWGVDLRNGGVNFHFGMSNVYQVCAVRTLP